MANVMDYISRGVFGLASVVLMLIALALSIYSAGLIVTGLAGPWGEAGHRLLESIGYVVIAVAVFDVARYFVEEEVIRGREMRLASEARRSLTKFVSTISIRGLHRGSRDGLSRKQQGRRDGALSGRDPVHGNSDNS